MTTSPSAKPAPTATAGTGQPGQEYLALQIYAAIGRLMGWATIIAAFIAFIVVQQHKQGSLPMAFGVLLALLVVGAGELAFAELLVLFVRLQGNTQYMCDRLAALERLAREAAPSAQPAKEPAGPKGEGIVPAQGMP